MGCWVEGGELPTGSARNSQICLCWPRCTVDGVNFIAFRLLDVSIFQCLGDFSVNNLEVACQGKQECLGNVG